MVVPAALTREAPIDLENHFARFRRHIVGVDQEFDTPYGRKKLLYSDWTASGRLYRPIEQRIAEDMGAFVANTHTETNVTGTAMTKAYHEAQHIIKQHVGAREEDVIISSNAGMTGVVNKFQRILGLKISEKLKPYLSLPEVEQPVIFISHMEHHSNHTSWLETLAKVEIIQPDNDGLMDLDHLSKMLEKHRSRKRKIAAITGCSNVTGILTHYHEVAEMMHRNSGLCFVDFACSAPYVDINMRPPNPLRHLDAIYFSPHKFLGGPGSTGILIFDPKLYSNKIPDHPGGGTVEWTNPWGEHKFVDNIEAREDGGTPPFLQTIKAALSIKLKEEMRPDLMLQQEKYLIDIIWKGLSKIPNLHLLADNVKERLGVFSFYIENVHYNLVVKMLNDRHGIQSRGGCSCAGTYGHYLLEVSHEQSKSITNKIDKGNFSTKPGWVRISIHPTMTANEIHTIVNAIEDLALHHQDYARDYRYNTETNEFKHVSFPGTMNNIVKNWFENLNH